MPRASEQFRSLALRHCRCARTAFHAALRCRHATAGMLSDGACLCSGNPVRGAWRRLAGSGSIGPDASRPWKNRWRGCACRRTFRSNVLGAKTWMLVFAEGDPSVLLKAKPTLDREASLRLAASLFPKETFEEIGTGDLSCTCPPDDEVHIGSFPGLAIVAAHEFAIDYPSRLPPHFLAGAPFGEVWLHAMHSAVDWFAFARWSKGRLVRSLSLSADMGLLE